MKVTKIGSLPVFLLGVLLSIPSHASEFYVAANGSDLSPGTKVRPFATLEKARDSIRQQKRVNGLPIGGVTVWIRGGSYYRSSSFGLSKEDSGAKGSPIIYRAYNGEDVRLVGGRRIKNFGAMTDPEAIKQIDAQCRPHVRQIDLRKLGITDYGRFQPRGDDLKVHVPAAPGAMELVFRDELMTLARWPNDGKWAIIAGNGTDIREDACVTYSGSRPEAWVNADDAWLHGYWFSDYSDSYLQIKGIEPLKQLIQLAGNGAYGKIRGGQRYYALNVLAELDRPGEYFIDRETGLLYFWPPEGSAVKGAVVTMIETPVVSLVNTSYLVLRDVTIECCRGTGVAVVGGRSNLIAACTIRNCGLYGAEIDGGKNNGIVACDISRTGESAIIVKGGDRQTLTPAGNYATNNCIYRYAYAVRTYRPGVEISGVGNRVTHNVICDAPHSAVYLTGNDHLIEYNRIFRVCLESNDAGAVYMGRNMTELGNVVRYNSFTDIHRVRHEGEPEDIKDLTVGVYLDDCESGFEVYGNIFERVGYGTLVSGGRWNRITNNVYIDCFVASIWATHWLDRYFNGTDSTMVRRMNEVPYKGPIWSKRFPELAKFWDDEPRVRKGIDILRNISVGENWLRIYDPDKMLRLRIEDNFTEGDPMFIDPSKGDYHLKPDSPALKLGFQQIPIEKIGLYKDEYRRNIPVVN